MSEETKDTIYTMEVVKTNDWGFLARINAGGGFVHVEVLSLTALDEISAKNKSRVSEK